MKRQTAGLSLRDKDLIVLALLALAVFLRFLPIWAKGLTPFWGDLTYLHHPWRAFDAETLQAGRLPLWDPYLYFGMPAAATMQDSLFYPGTLPFFFWGFATALAVYHFLQYWLCAALSYLWLRSWRLSRGASVVGCVSLSWGGMMLSRLSFLNHLAVLALAPALFLFFSRPALLCSVLALMFFAGYPPFFIGSIIASWALVFIFSRPEERLKKTWDFCRTWSKAAVASVALSACLLLPAWELFSLSPRAHELNYADIFRFQFAPVDLLRWISPWIASGPAFNPAVEWWKCCYIGFAGCAAALWGLASLPWKKSALAAAALLVSGLLILGNTNPVSNFFWRHAGLLRFIRYPGNLAYLAAFTLCPLAAAGAERFPKRWLAVLVLWLELSIGIWHAVPLAPRGIFTSAGPLVHAMQKDAGAGRYLLSPKTLEIDRGLSYEDWKHRLYGLTNAPYHLAAGGSFGDPLAPRENYGFMDFIYSQDSAQAAAKVLAWGGVANFLTGQKLPTSPLLSDHGRTLWHIYKIKRPVSLAYFFTLKDGAAIPEMESAAAMPSAARPVSWDIPREDAFFASGHNREPGWLYVSWPRYPGWIAQLATPQGRRSAVLTPAMGLFQKIEVPAGPWSLRMRYDPLSFRLGLWLSLASWIILALAAWRGLEIWRHAD